MGALGLLLQLRLLSERSLLLVSRLCSLSISCISARRCRCSCLSPRCSSWSWSCCCSASHVSSSGPLAAAAAPPQGQARLVPAHRISVSHDLLHSCTAERSYWLNLLAMVPAVTMRACCPCRLAAGRRRGPGHVGLAQGGAQPARRSATAGCLCRLHDGAAAAEPAGRALQRQPAGGRYVLWQEALPELAQSQDGRLLELQRRAPACSLRAARWSCLTGGAAGQQLGQGPAAALLAPAPSVLGCCLLRTWTCG
jgi:hypothetical protein